jgi:hypothetical protein
MRSIVTSLGIGRAYRIRWFNRLAFLFVFGVSVAFAVGMFRGAREDETQRALWNCFGMGLLAVTSGILTLSSFYNRVTLYANAIEFRSVWSTSWLQFAEIRGRQKYSAGGGRGIRIPHLRILPNDERLPILDFEKHYNFDDAFYAWFNRLPDLDQYLGRPTLA